MLDQSDYITTLVTGGTGFLGKNLVKALAAKGENLKVLARKTSDISGLDTLGVEIVHGDITDFESVKRAMLGCERVYHAAALVKSWVRDKSEYDRINVEGLKNVLQSARELNVDKVVYTSTFMALGPSGDRIVDESTERDPSHVHNDYERTKTVADALTAELFKEVPLIKVYPGVIYGPGELTAGNIIVTMINDFLTDRFFLFKKVPGILGDGKKVWNYVFVDDVVNGHILAMEKGKPGDRFILGGENKDLNELFHLLSELTGLKPPTLHLPYWSGKISAAFEELLAVTTGREPFLTRAVVDIWKHHWAMSSKKAADELGYTSRPLRDGLKTTLDWIDKEGLVKNRRKT